MPETLKITPTAHVTVVEHTPGLLVLEAGYGPASKPPPPHLHPAQDERFTVLEGTLGVRVGGAEHTLGVGDTLDVPRETVHQMWNLAQAPARVRWEVRPAGRTLEWFRAFDALHRSGQVAGNGLPKPHHLAALLTEYRDVFRLAGPAGALAPALRVVAPLGRSALDER